jgi:hypothetical protein
MDNDKLIQELSSSRKPFLCSSQEAVPLHEKENLAVSGDYLSLVLILISFR